MHHHNGFSLIELMIVVAIISILSVIAIPSYQHYTQRARFTEVIAATLPFKTAIAIALQQGESMDELNNGVHGIPDSPPPTQNLAKLTVLKGVITATGTKAAGGKQIILTPDTLGSVWSIQEP